MNKIFTTIDINMKKCFTTIDINMGKKIDINMKTKSNYRHKHEKKCTTIDIKCVYLYMQRMSAKVAKPRYKNEQNLI